MSLSEELVEKIYQEDFYGIRRLILGGVDVNFADENNISPLMRAVLSGNSEITVLLLDGGADPNFLNFVYGATPLIIAVKTNKHDLIEILLDNGADVALSDNNGISAIWHASFQGDLEAVTILTNYGCPVDLLDKNLRTPLILTSYRGFMPVAAYLISCGANINAKDNIGGTPLSWACYGGHPALVKYLIALGADISVRNIEGKSILTLAKERKNNFEVINILLEAGVTGT